MYLANKKTIIYGNKCKKTPTQNQQKRNPN